MIFKCDREETGCCRKDIKKNGTEEKPKRKNLEDEF